MPYRSEAGHTHYSTLEVISFLYLLSAPESTHTNPRAQELAVQYSNSSALSSTMIINYLRLLVNRTLVSPPDTL